MDNTNYGEYEIPMEYGQNYKYLTEQQAKVVIEEKECVLISTDRNQKNKTRSYADKLTLTLPIGVKCRLKNIAKHQDRRYHTMATDIILNYLNRQERKIKKETLK
jgi:hypothetical protein